MPPDSKGDTYLLSGISCSSASSCVAGGGVNGGPGPAAALSSTDGAATWTVTAPFDSTGWLSTISCADTQHCWAAGAGTTAALAGTTDSGSTWSTVTSDTTNEGGQVSCATLTFCLTATDCVLWVTNTDGGLTGVR